MMDTSPVSGLAVRKSRAKSSCVPSPQSVLIPNAPRTSSQPLSSTEVVRKLADVSPGQAALVTSSGDRSASTSG